MKEGINISGVVTVNNPTTFGSLVLRGNSTGVIDLEMYCRHCHHHVLYSYDGQLYHAFREQENSKENSYYLTKSCGFIIEDERANKMKEDALKDMSERVKKDYQGYYELSYWYFDIQCSCKNPEL